MIEDFDALWVVFMIEEMDIIFDQFYGGLIDSAVQGDGSIAVHFSSDSDTEEIREIFGSGSQEVEVPDIAIPRRLFRRAMKGSMIGLVTPLFEPFVQVRQ